MIKTPDSKPRVLDSIEAGGKSKGLNVLITRFDPSSESIYINLKRTLCGIFYCCRNHILGVICVTKNHHMSLSCWYRYDVWAKHYINRENGK